MWLGAAVAVVATLLLTTIAAALESSVNGPGRRVVAAAVLWAFVPARSGRAAQPTNATDATDATDKADEADDTAEDEAAAAPGPATSDPPSPHA